MYMYTNTHAFMQGNCFANFTKEHITSSHLKTSMNLFGGFQINSTIFYCINMNEKGRTNLTHQSQQVEHRVCCAK